MHWYTTLECTAKHIKELFSYSDNAWHCFNALFSVSVLFTLQSVIRFFIIGFIMVTSFQLLIRWGVTICPISLSDIRKIYPKVVSDFRRNFFRISKLVWYVCMRNTNVSNFSSQCFRYCFGYLKSCSDLLWRFALRKYYLPVESTVQYVIFYSQIHVQRCNGLL